MSDLSRATWLRKTMAAFGLFLFVITWRLWTAQSAFPQIPFFSWLTEVPRAIDYVASVGTLIGLIAMLLNHRWVKPAIVLFLASTSFLVLLNQHRLQPWVYLMLVTSCLLVCLPSKFFLIWLRRIVISIYIYSAISKFDYQFVFTVGDQMLDVLLGFAGLAASGLPQWLQVTLVLCLPLGEFLIGGLLLFSKTRKLGGWLAISLHASLLLVLGPLGLNHQPGVLIWNAWFIVQAWLLFASSHPVEKQQTSGVSEDSSSETKPTRVDSSPVELVWCGRLLALFVIVFPITCAVSPWIELPIKADHWVAWEVYAPRSSRAFKQTPKWRTSSASLDEPLDDQPTFKPQTSNQWSLDTLGVPIYPQGRFQAACWLAVSEREYSTNRRGSVVIVSGTADRLTGQRKQTRIDGPVDAQKYRQKLWFNTLPR